MIIYSFANGFSQSDIILNYEAAKKVGGLGVLTLNKVYWLGCVSSTFSPAVKWATEF